MLSFSDQVLNVVSRTFNPSASRSQRAGCPLRKRFIKCFPSTPTRWRQGARAKSV